MYKPEAHLIKVMDKDYLPVQYRLAWFRSQFPHATIETKLVTLDMDAQYTEPVWIRGKKTTRTACGIAVFHTVIRDGRGGVATGTKSEKAASFDDFVEKAESGSIGRALAALGYGTQFACV
jgi:hypothetical protein